MPRKRKATVKRNQPNCPEGDEGKSLTEDERMKKLAVFAKDFDLEFQEKLKKMDSGHANLLKSIESCLHCQLIQLPASIRNMKLKDFIACGGTVEAALAPTKSVDPGPSSLHISGKLTQTISKLNPNILCGVIPEEEESCSELRAIKKSCAKATGTVRRSTRQRKTKGNESMRAPPSCSKTRMTPAGRKLSSYGWSTPFITPKFDPRLPFTPGLNRDPKPGERILSMAGSPINNPQDTCTKKERPMGKSRFRTLTVSSETKDELDNITIPESPTDIRNMRQSQVFKAINMLSKIIKQSDDDVF